MVNFCHHLPANFDGKLAKFKKTVQKITSYQILNLFNYKWNGTSCSFKMILLLFASDILFSHKQQNQKND